MTHTLKQGLTKYDVAGIIEVAWEIIQQHPLGGLMRPRELPRKIAVKNTRAGYARSIGDITISITYPEHMFKFGSAYATYVIIHELCHVYHHNHGDDFKRLESAVLKHWGIRIEYSRAYAKKIRHNGTIVYNRAREKERKIMMQISQELASHRRPRRRRYTYSTPRFPFRGVVNS